MRLHQIVSFLALAGLAASRSLKHVRKDRVLQETNFQQFRKRQIEQTPRRALESEDFSEQVESSHYRRAGTTIIPQNKNTTKFAVNGTAFPDVHFDIGESYAGLLPISSKANETSKLFFWFFPSANPDASDEITIWLNGGPGCSSLEGLFQENGPVIWQYGTYQPVKNPYTWVNLTNMLWVEQPVGTGFTEGTPTARNEEDLSAQFMGFFKNFIDTFGLQNRKIFITGESYAGQYVPYIASAMLDTKDKVYYGVDSIMIYDPTTSYEVIQEQIPAVPFAQFHHSLFSLNDTFLASVTQKDIECGYKDFREKYLVWPPPGPIPTPPDGSRAGCDVFDDIFNAVSLVNPCFDIYQVATTCPLLWDVLGFPGSFDYSPVGAPNIYFNRPSVQKLLHVPVQMWSECSDGVFPHGDASPPTGLSVLPGVIERTQRTVIAHGQLDMILIPNGTLLMIQNMTWNGKQGFQTKPSSPFFVPYHTDYQLGTLAGAGRMGTTHTERGLTWVETWLSGHMIPQYAPSASYRQLEFMLGRISSLTMHGSFTTQ